MKTQYFTITLATLLLLGCGGGGGGETASNEVATPPVVTTPAPEVYTGIFVDSAVENLSYSTDSGSGRTNDKGEFSYQLNETIVFSIGGITFPAVEAQALMTPLTVFNTQDMNEDAVVNMLRLLQSLDVDGDASNGIEISNTFHEVAEALSIDFSNIDFDEQLADFIAVSGSINQQLISASEAIEHFQTTLNNQELGSCDKTHPKVGYSGFFSTLAHNVAGKATIIDDCTIQITQFDYDGGGPAVAFYAARDHEYSSASAFPISQYINGQVYDNASILLTLPTNKSLDDLTGISVWCADFNADFGNMTFSP
jgi:hypothetical protein